MNGVGEGTRAISSLRRPAGYVSPPSGPGVKRDRPRPVAKIMQSPELSRRNFLKSSAVAGTVAAVSTALGSLRGADAAQAGSAPPRRGLVAHRNLYNGDCNFLFYNPEMWQPEGGRYTARALHRCIDLLGASGVDTVLFNPNTHVVWYPSKKLEYVLAGYRRGDREFARPMAAGNPGLSPAQVEQSIDVMIELFNLYSDLTDAGVDWLAESAKACRERGISPWLSYRMNPTHFSGAEDSSVNGRLFRQRKYHLSGRVPDGRGSADGGWIGLNYAFPEVRQNMFEMMREGVESYDYEGLEMDWLRHPVCLEATATPGQTAMMTDWFAEVRAMTRARRPNYVLGMRAPGNLGYLRAIGIDLKELVRRGLVDFVTFSNFWQTPWEMPHDALRRELGPEITIYGGMEDAPNWLETIAPALTERPAYQELQLAGDNAYQAGKHADAPKRIRGTRYLSASKEFLRANAAGKLALGADGVEQFNFFVTDQVRVPGQRADFAALRQLADPAFLRGREKHYALNTCSTQTNKIWDMPEQLPVRVAPQRRRAFRLPMGAEPADYGVTLVVQVVAGRTAETPRTGVSVNGAWPVYACRSTNDLLFPAGPYRQHVEEHAAWNYSFSVSSLREGWNEFTLYNEGSVDLVVMSLEIGIVKT